MEYLNYLIDTYNIPLLSAFLLGIMTAISPCPLATNITAIAYISKQLNSIKQTLFHSLIYAFGRIFSYSLIILLIEYGFSTFSLSKLFQGYGDKIIGPILIIIGLIMLNIIKLPSFKSGNKLNKIKEFLKTKGYIGTFLLGVLFAMAFCPYSGVIFFGILIPIVLKSNYPILLSLLFGFGTALPVIIFTIIFVFSINKMSKIFCIVGKIEEYMRYSISYIFIIVGIYYSYITLKWIYAIF